MDNKKTGKLISDLRNAKGMTQQELGDKVGVGFRAVSKWERGLTMPDIAIINELSKILGITSDELLSGKLKKNKNKDNNLIKILIIAIIAIITISIITFGIVTFYQNKTYVYNIKCIESDKYYIEGQVTFYDNEITIIVNKLNFKDESLPPINIKDYRYNVISKDTFIFGYGYHLSGRYIDEGKTISQFAETFTINYTGDIELTRKEIVNNNLTLIIEFIDSNNEPFNTEIELVLIKQK